MRPEYEEVCAEVKRLRNDVTELQKLCHGLLRPKNQKDNMTQKKKFEARLQEMVEKHNKQFKH